MSSERYAAPRPQLGGGEPLLFPEDTEALARTLRSLRSLGSLFNEQVATPLQQLTVTDAAVELGDDDALTALITNHSAYLVDRAKAETLPGPHKQEAPADAAGAWQSSHSRQAGLQSITAPK